MKVLVTGASGSLGRHVVDVLLRCEGVEVIASGRNEQVLSSLGCRYLAYDLDDHDPGCYHQLGRPEAVIHLAWEGLGDYHALHHVEQTLSAHYRFLKAMVEAGAGTIVCTGTCFEYGLQQGCIDETQPTQPTIAYAVAKDSLRRFLECLQRDNPFSLRWLRLFFLLNETGRPGTLFAQFDRALDDGAASFPMSGGEQLRDYLPIETVAEYVVRSTLQSEVDGAINICKGTPISVRKVLEQRMRERGQTIRLDFGRYPYPEHEPMAYWGDNRRLRRILAATEQLMTSNQL